MDDFLDGVIGFVISGFQWNFGTVGLVVKETVGERAAEALMEKEEQQRHFSALVGEAIGVVVPVALYQIMVSAGYLAVGIELGSTRGPVGL
jgi:hypothetical protein